MKEFSFGIIPLKKIKNSWKVLLIRHGKGHWAFPKGHANENESPEMTAVRELKEETNLEIKKWLSKEPLQEHYFFSWKGELIEKWVLYFIAEVSGKVILQEEEVSASRWLTLDQAEELATFKETKLLIQKISQLLKRL